MMVFRDSLAPPVHAFHRFYPSDRLTKWNEVLHTCLDASVASVTTAAAPVASDVSVDRSWFGSSRRLDYSTSKRIRLCTFGDPNETRMNGMFLKQCASLFRFHDAASLRDGRTSKPNSLPLRCDSSSFNSDEPAGWNSRNASSFEPSKASGLTPSTRHVIITGGNSGIGKAMAIELANLGMEIVLACRNEKLGNIAAEEIRKITNNPNISCMHCDLSSLSSIKKFSMEYLNTGKPLHILINNAGIMASPKSFTEDGFEMQFGVNHLGHFYLTGLLFERMVHSAIPGNFSRIVVVTSAAEKLGNFDWSDLNFKNNRWYNRWNAYSQSKLANCLFVLELSKKCSENNLPVSINCFHPGIVDTMLIRHIVPQYFLSRKISSPEQSAMAAKFLGLKTPEEGASTGVFLATSQSIESESGKYFESSQIGEASAKAKDPSLASKLWQASEALTDFKFSFPQNNSEK